MITACADHSVEASVDYLASVLMETLLTGMGCVCACV